MKKYLNKCNIYILLWCVYYLQGIAYVSGGVLSQLILLVLMLISVYYFFKVNIESKVPTFIKVLNIFIGVMTIYGILLMFDGRPIYFDHIISEKVGKLNFLKAIYISLLPLYPMYTFAKQNLLDTRIIKAVTLILLISTTLSFFRNQQELLQKAIESGSMREEFTNNVAYEFLCIFPLLFFWSKKPILQFLLLGYIFMFIIMGMKRGAILVGAVCLIWFLYRIYKSSTKRNKTIITIITIIAIIAGTIYAVNFYNNSEYFQQRIEQTLEGNSSGRDSIYSSLWNYYISQDSLLHQLLGNGAMQTVMIAGNYAHNDWLELLICHGVLGVGVYIAYFISLYKLFKQNKNNPLIYNILGMCLMIMFASSIFSMSYNSLSLSITMCLGYCLAYRSQQL